MVGNAIQHHGLAGSAGALPAGGQDVDARFLKHLEDGLILRHQQRLAGQGELDLEGRPRGIFAGLHRTEVLGAQRPRRQVPAAFANGREQRLGTAAVNGRIGTRSGQPP